MSVWMLWKIIWTCFFTKPVYWQNSCVILEKSYISRMSSFSTEMWQADRSRSQESNKIEFASNELFYLKIFKSEWSKVNIGRMRDLSLKAAISMLFLFLFIHMETHHFDLQSSSSAQNINRWSNLSIMSNLLLFESQTQKCLQNIKQRISSHFIYKTQQNTR